MRFLLILFFILCNCNSYSENVTLDSKNFFSYFKSMLEEDNVDLQNLIDFVEQFKELPLLYLFEKKIEDKITSDECNKHFAKNWFTKHPPKTFKGICNFMQNGGKTEDLRKFWEKTSITIEEQAELLKKFKNLLNTKDHKDRIEILLLDGKRNIAEDLCRLLDWPIPRLLLFEIVKKHHDKNPRESEKALNLLKQKVPNEEKFPNDFGKLRIYYARYCMERKRYKEALNILEKHKIKQGELYSEALWLQGWIFFNGLKQYNKALNIFSLMEKSVKAPISKARALYYKGMCLKALKKAYKETLKKASQYTSTFYGQLARSEIGQSDIHCLKDTVRIDNYGFLKKNFWLQTFLSIPKNEKEHIRAAFRSKISSRPIYDAKLLNSLLWEVSKFGNPHDAPWIFREMRMKNNIPVVRQAYPVLDKTKMTFNKNEALVLSLILRESVFDANITSNKDAKGLMQLLESTAKIEIKKQGIIINPLNLYDPKTNVRIGTLHLNSLIKEFNGSNILALAAYNAGAHRVKEWIKNFGHPSKIGNIKWIEMIPFGETRNYVQRVLENMQAYTCIEDFKKIVN